ncbi:MAG: hypothetical protein JST85_05255 [Acidobacteria bacterium]|nr:hypothetical protein [Acidobacteriota bacterium]
MSISANRQIAVELELFGQFECLGSGQVLLEGIRILRIQVVLRDPNLFCLGVACC